MTINSIATPIWNEIAKTQELKTTWAKKVFPMNQEQMVIQVNEEYGSLKKQGVPVETAKAYLDLKPLLLENVAISRHIQRTNQPSLRAALPEVTTISEAVTLASRDQFLSQAMQQHLERLLSDDLNSTEE